MGKINERYISLAREQRGFYLGRGCTLRYTVKWNLVDGEDVAFQSSAPSPPPVAPWPASVAVISGCRLHRGRQNSSSSFLPKLHLYKSLRTYLPGVEEIEHGSRQLGPFFIFLRDLKVGRRGTPWEANGALLI